MAEKSNIRRGLAFQFIEEQLLAAEASFGEAMAIAERRKADLEALINAHDNILAAESDFVELATKLGFVAPPVAEPVDPEIPEITG